MLPIETQAYPRIDLSSPLPHEYRDGLWDEKGRPVVGQVDMSAAIEAPEIPPVIAFGVGMTATSAITGSEQQIGEISDWLKLIATPEGRTLALSAVGFGLGVRDMWPTVAKEPFVQKVTKSAYNGLDRAADWAIASWVVHRAFGVEMPQIEPWILGTAAFTNGFDIMRTLVLRPLNWINQHIGGTHRT